MKTFYFFLLCILCLMPFMAEGKVPVDSVAENKKLEVCHEIHSLRGKDGFLQRCDSMLVIARETGDDKIISSLLLDKIRHYGLIGNFSVKEKMRKATEECIAFCNSTPGYSDILYYGWNGYITFLINHSEFDEALAEIKRMQQNATETNDPCGVYMSYVAYGNLNSLQKFYKESAEYLEKAIAYYHEHKKELQGITSSAAYSNLSGIYVTLGMNDKAEAALKEAISEAHSFSDDLRTSLARLYEHTGQWDKLKETLDSIQINRTTTAAKRDVYYRAWVSYDLHIKDYQHALEQAKFIKIPKAYLSLYETYNALGDYKQALYYKTLTDSAEISSLSNILNEQLNDVNRRFDYEKIITQKLLENQRKTRQLLLWACGILLIIFLFFSSYTYNRHRYTKQLKLLQKETQKALELKDALIANMSHEIRTPLNAIQGFTQILSTNDSLDSETKSQLSTGITSNTQLLTKILNNIIDLSELETRDVKPIFKSASPKELIQMALDSVSMKNTDKVELITEIDVAPDYRFQTDSNLFAKALSQLIDNAMKFTPEGQIIIRAAISSDTGKLVFSVTDTGIGISEEDRKKIFERFSKVNNFIPGTGLGLNLSQCIAKILNGEISLDPSYTSGSRFLFTIG